MCAVHDLPLDILACSERHVLFRLLDHVLFAKAFATVFGATRCGKYKQHIS